MTGGKVMIFSHRWSKRFPLEASDTHGYVCEAWLHSERDGKYETAIDSSA